MPAMSDRMLHILTYFQMVRNNVRKNTFLSAGMTRRKYDKYPTKKHAHIVWYSEVSEQKTLKKITDINEQHPELLSSRFTDTLEGQGHVKTTQNVPLSLDCVP